MTFYKLLLPATALLTLAAGAAAPAAAQSRGTQAYRANNAQQTRDMRLRLAAAIDRGLRIANHIR